MGLPDVVKMLGYVVTLKCKPNMKTNNFLFFNNLITREVETCFILKYLLRIYMLVLVRSRPQGGDKYCRDVMKLGPRVL